MGSSNSKQIKNKHDIEIFEESKGVNDKENTFESEYDKIKIDGMSCSGKDLNDVVSIYARKHQLDINLSEKVGSLKTEVTQWRERDERLE